MKTGNCYENSGRIFMDINMGFSDMRGWGDKGQWTLVHALVTGQGPIEGLTFGHAWLEWETESGLVFALDTAALESGGIELLDQAKMVPAVVYRKVAETKFVVEYEWTEAKRMIVDEGHWGPWADEMDGHP